MPSNNILPFSSTDYSTIIIGVYLTILLLLVIVVGYYSKWYQNLNRDSNSAIPLALSWIAVSIVSFAGFYLLPPGNQDVFVYSVIGTVLSVVWSTIFFYSKNFVLSYQVLTLIIIYQCWLVLLISSRSIVAAFLQIPILVLYLYFATTVRRLASNNGVNV